MVPSGSIKSAKPKVAGEVIRAVHLQAHTDADHACALASSWIEGEQLEGELVFIIITAPYTVGRTFFALASRLEVSVNVPSAWKVCRGVKGRFSGDVTDPGAYDFAAAIIVRLGGISTGGDGCNHRNNDQYND